MDFKYDTLIAAFDGKNRKKTASSGRKNRKNFKNRKNRELLALEKQRKEREASALKKARAIKKTASKRLRARDDFLNATSIVYINVDENIEKRRDFDAFEVLLWEFPGPDWDDDSEDWGGYDSDDGFDA